MHGKGMHHYKDGTAVEGNFCNDDINGKGQIRFANGVVYNGDIRHYLADGFGEGIYPNGDKYIGEWKGSKRHGRGVLHISDGRICKAEWSDDIMVPMSDRNHAHAEDGVKRFIIPLYKTFYYGKGLRLHPIARRRKRKRYALHRLGLNLMEISKQKKAND
eukprot:TRINITY_DN15602_c0_g1_i7.p2 TRINITY_DN15602_c0_g1~~TRINITY_DN15602_c0_g1_i7.p2  ORF type:complete len:160 (-),score=10.27 TRINITY_DN15602_c0_g1_i7:67-546(-)